MKGSDPLYRRIRILPYRGERPTERLRLSCRCSVGILRMAGKAGLEAGWAPVASPRLHPQELLLSDATVLMELGARAA